MSAATIRIQSADLHRRADAAALLSLLDAYAADPMGDGRGLSAEARACLIPVLRGMSGALVLLADADGQAVGAAVCFVGFSTFRARGLFNVHDLAVLPEWRNRGIGQRLLAQVEAVARARGYCKVTLEVRADNESALGLYRKLGYGAGTGAGTGAGGAAQYLFMEKRFGD
ncbi:MAG: GNAT family N-acetyltransferase [Thiohalocapsa sp.]|nr:GNAT family N-acetyltransferase [Thiohalocapsa sp.]MCF7989173.1 GNAT family N-acetyltransferase [Thiohalocapsa sp.]